MYKFFSRSYSFVYFTYNIHVHCLYPGPSILMDVTQTSETLRKAITGTWPMLLLVLSSAGIAGISIWALVSMRLQKGGLSSLLPSYFCPFSLLLFFTFFLAPCSILLFYNSLLPNEVSSPCSLVNLPHSPRSFLIFSHSPCSLITPLGVSSI